MRMWPTVHLSSPELRCDAGIGCKLILKLGVSCCSAQYRVDGASCVYRLFDEDNSTLVNGWTYLVESLYHEMFLQVGC